MGGIWRAHWDECGEPRSRRGSRAYWRQMALVAAALFETVALLGGLWWIIHGRLVGHAAAPRVAAVVALAVLGAGSLAVAVVRRYGADSAED
jgi:hypothetical protein